MQRPGIVQGIPRNAGPAARGLLQRAGDEDAGVATEVVEIVRQTLIDNDLAVVSWRGGVHKMQDAVARPLGESDMRGADQPPVVRTNADDVAGLQARFDACNFA